MCSVEFLPYLIQIQMSEIVMQILEVRQWAFNEHHMLQLPITENQLGLMQMPVNDFFFPWEEAGSAENPIAIDKDEVF